jgi:hypothetical protein
MTPASKAFCIFLIYICAVIFIIYLGSVSQ